MTYTFNYSTQTNDEFIQGYTDLIRERIDDGWSGFLCSFMFRPINPNPKCAIVLMKDAISKFYSTLLTRVIRDPHCPSSVGCLPVLISVADLPRPGANAPLADTTINGGLHFHGILLIPAKNRLRVSLMDHVGQNLSTYLPIDGIFSRIHIQPIEDRPDQVVDYAFKSIKKFKINYDDGALVLPRASSEVVLGPKEADNPVDRNWPRKENTRWPPPACLPN